MYRISKVLNHNTVLAVREASCQEYLIMGKGIGFGKKVAEHITLPEDASVYSLQETTGRGKADVLARSIEPEYLEAADLVLDEAARVFGSVDRSVIFPMADHIAYAVKRLREHEPISNPLTEDIRLLFYPEYKVALTIVPILKQRMGVEMDEHEVGYVALHVHTAIEKAELSQAMQIAQGVRDCVSCVENELGKKLNVMSLSYNRLMNHVRYMVARQMSGEELRLDMNEYMEQRFPREFQMAEQICRKMEENMHCVFPVIEVGYLAMHLQRILEEEEKG